MTCNNSHLFAFWESLNLLESKLQSLKFKRIKLYLRRIQCQMTLSSKKTLNFNKKDHRCFSLSPSEVYERLIDVADNGVLIC